ncbi:helix-turn-helix domain-containing protein [Nocardioides marmorisolisilvae]|uniref:DNA-binding protein n=1 Tax=Nocardioides marmorisolisilvae TaxID=1542737 RepID=A0A3N0DPS7_9ACTN|nr:helix-turn-helix domain-containing protein [Nocardioides marmorisolisilvae]RNL77644.1 DNA-binding protein [Nocardioides marmorisolisilvae]
MDKVEAASTAIAENSDSAGLEGLPVLVSVPRAAQLLGISRSAAYRCAASGDLPTAHLGGRVYVVTAQLRHMLLGRRGCGA